MRTGLEIIYAQDFSSISRFSLSRYLLYDFSIAGGNCRFFFLANFMDFSLYSLLLDFLLRCYYYTRYFILSLFLGDRLLTTRIDQVASSGYCTHSIPFPCINPSKCYHWLWGNLSTIICMAMWTGMQWNWLLAYSPRFSDPEFRRGMATKRDRGTFTLFNNVSKFLGSR